MTKVSDRDRLTDYVYIIECTHTGVFGATVEINSRSKVQKETVNLLLSLIVIIGNRLTI